MTKNVKKRKGRNIIIIFASPSKSRTSQFLDVAVAQAAGNQKKKTEANF
jgi:hypothetical protein